MALIDISERIRNEFRNKSLAMAALLLLPRDLAITYDLYPTYATNSVKDIADKAGEFLTEDKAIFNIFLINSTYQKSGLPKGEFYLSDGWTRLVGVDYFNPSSDDGICKVLQNGEKLNLWGRYKSGKLEVFDYKRVNKSVSERSFFNGLESKLDIVPE